MAFEENLLNQPQKKGSLFSHKQIPPMEGLTPNQLNELIRRLKILEERYTNLQTRSQLTEQNMLSRNRSFATEIKTIISDIHEIKREVEEIKNRILMIIKELQASARKEELKILERYVNMWEPVKFVTHNEVEEVVKEILAKYAPNRNL